MAYTKHDVDVSGSPMEILTFRPEGDGPHPGVVVTQHLPVAHAGLETDPWQLDVGEKLATHGYVAVIPYMFHWWPREADMADKRAAWRDDNSVLDLKAAYDELLTVPGVDANRIGIMGHCWGGRASWVGACHNPNFKACGVFYGGRILASMSDGATPPVELCANMKCDVIGVFGNDDQNPSPEDVDVLDRALDEAGIDHAFHRYDGAGHGFQDFTNPDRWRPDQTEDSWSKFFSFFDARLKG
ncbi:MAG: dienelactone hydrolase family protein [Rhodospirillaceae bacterium]